VYKVNAGLDGFIQDISAVTTGSYVAKEQWLASFATPEIRQPISAFIVTVDYRPVRDTCESQALRSALVTMPRQRGLFDDLGAAAATGN